MKKCKQCHDTLDATNIRIVQRLQRNARTSYATIAQELSLSVNTVRDRVLNMERKGIILGYQPVVDDTLRGRPVEALVALRSNGRAKPVDTDELQHSFVTAAYTSAGPVNLLLEVHGPSMQAISDFISESIYPLGYHSAHFFLVETEEVPADATVAEGAPSEASPILAEVFP